MIKKAAFTIFLFLLCLLGLAQTAELLDDSLRIVRMEYAEKLVPGYKKLKPFKDSAFVVNHSDYHSYELMYMYSGKYAITNNILLEEKKKGDVIGPLSFRNAIGLFKVNDKIIASDSVQVRHILVTYHDAERADPGITRTKKQAKARADSICSAVRHGTPMESLVTPQYTDDPGSWSGNKGNYGWFTRESGFVKEFKDAGFNNPVGKTFVIETAFGYHVIQVLAKTKERPILVCSFISLTVNYDEVEARDSIYKEAVFPGGRNCLMAYLHDSVRYPETERKNGVEGDITIVFTIDTLGNVDRIVSVDSIKDHPAFTEEAKRLIFAMPRWKPGTASGKAIEWTWTLNVEFILPPE